MSEKPIERMTFDELRKEVRLQRDELTRLKRSYEDAIYNIGTDNFDKKFVVEQDNMKSQIRVAADEISTAVSQIYNEAVYTSVKPGTPGETFDIDKLYYYGGSHGDNCYYYYNNISKKWEKSDSMCIFSRFKQTAQGFELKGDVKINGDLNGCGGTFSGNVVADTFIIEPKETATSFVIRAAESTGGPCYDALQATAQFSRDEEDNRLTFQVLFDHGDQIVDSDYAVIFNFDHTIFNHDVDFSYAKVDGLHAVFA